MNYVAAIVAVAMAVVFAGNDSKRITKFLNKHYSFQIVSDQTAAMIIGLLIYLPPLGLFFLPSILFQRDLVCGGVVLASLWILLGYLFTGAKQV